jgi:membrane-associated phospholipid phosphatase
LLTNITKTAYHQARPFWDSSDVEDLGGCSTQFGNPSGHSLTSFAFVIAMWLDYNHNAEKFEQAGSLLGKLWMRILMLLAGIAFAVTVAYSRFVLGMHSSN